MNIGHAYGSWEDRDKLKYDYEPYFITKIHIKEKNMFTKSQAEFILKSAEKDLEVLNKRYERDVQEMAELGVKLSEMQVARDHITGIIQAIKEAVSSEEDDE